MDKPVDVVGILDGYISAINKGVGHCITTDGLIKTRDAVKELIEAAKIIEPYLGGVEILLRNLGEQDGLKKINNFRSSLARVKPE